MQLQSEASKKIVDRMSVIVSELKEHPESMSNLQRYSFAVWAMLNNEIGLVPVNVTDRFIYLVCPDYWECHIAGVHGELRYDGTRFKV